MADQITISVKPKTVLMPVEGDKAQGVPGLSAYQLYLQSTSDDPKMTLSEWLLSLEGRDGDDGNDGSSAYQIAVDNGFSGTEQEWIYSLKGTDGKSSYQIAVDQGFTGTEAEWLESLKGDQGKTLTYEDLTDENKAELMLPATEAATLANSAAENATSKAALANSAAQSASSAGEIALTKAAYAEAQGNYAKAQAEYIESADVLTASDVSQNSGSSETDIMSQKAVTDRISKILNITATRTLATDDWNFGTFSVSEFFAISAIAANGIPIFIRFAGVTGGVAENIMQFPGIWNETLQQITCRDLARGFYLNAGVAANRGARSYDTQKYIDIGAVFNDVTGYYEYLGLTDNTESACSEAYSLWLGPKTPFYFNYRNLGPKKTKFLFPITWVDENMTTGRSTLFYGSARIKRIRLCANMMLPDSPTNLFYAAGGIAYITASSEITYIGGGIDMKSVVSDVGANGLISAGCTHIMLYNCKVAINLSASTVLDYESVLNVPKYSAATTTKVFTLSSAVATSARAAYLLNPEPGYATLDLYSHSKNYNIATV